MIQLATEHFCRESLTWVDRCFLRLVYISIALMQAALTSQFPSVYERLSRVRPQSNLNRSDTQICTNMQSKQAFALLLSLIRRQLSLFLPNKTNGLLMLWLGNSYAKSFYTCQHFKITTKIPKPKEMKDGPRDSMRPHIYDRIYAGGFSESPELVT